MWCYFLSLAQMSNKNCNSADIRCGKLEFDSSGTCFPIDLKGGGADFQQSPLHRHGRATPSGNGDEGGGLQARKIKQLMRK